jgi:prepilin-type N-terminal cleavage/methylation domain-containing protein
MFNIRKGFTLIELLIVMAVIAVLIGIAIPSFRGMQTQAKITKAQGDMRVLKLALESYNARHNVYPAALSAVTLETVSIISTLPTDPFAATAGTSYGYATSGVNGFYYCMWSVGPNNGGACTINASGIVTTGEANEVGTSNGKLPAGGNWN